MKKLAFILTILFFASCNSSSIQETENQHRERPSASQIIQEFDSNNDGKLSVEELNGGPIAQDFQKLDNNQDGFLSEKELENAPKPPKNNPHSEEVTISKEDIDSSMLALPLNLDFFIQENFIGKITQEKVNLSGIETLCYIIKTNSQATEHPMGPWCPKHIEDGMEKAGIWFKDGKVYDVSGHFIAELSEFYSDDKWQLYDEDGNIRITETLEACLAAAKPDVEDEFQNYCVQCLPEYFKEQITTFVIPATPIYLKNTQNFGRGGIGIAFNGVNYDPPAPTHAILAAHTIAPLDDHGGHVNPHGGYHYHAVTGSTKEIEQEDDHAPMIGYAIDGFGIYALLDKNKNKATDLDECGGHFDEIRGYHYHAGAPGDNQILKCLHGLAGYTEVQE